MEEVLPCSRESFKYQKVIKKHMASKDTITFSKVKAYSMPEDSWDNSENWFLDFEKRLTGYNAIGGAKTIRMDSKYGSQSIGIKEALKIRIDNKNDTTGDYGYGKCMKNIIGEYVITLEDKQGLQKKFAIMEEMIGIFNGDEKLTSTDPQGPKEIINEGFLELTGDNAVTITLAIIADEDPNKITVGKAMGYLNGNFPHLRPKMKTLAGKVAKGVAEINKRVKGGEIESIKSEAIEIYPKVFEESSESIEENNEPIFYQFKAGDLLPEIVRYQVGEEVKEIELSKLIRKMKHDKSAYAWLNQHKPNGGPNWPQGGSGQYYLVISNDPFQNYTKSTGRYWEQNSCERYNSFKEDYALGPITDIRYGNCVVFAFKGPELPKNWPEVQPTNKPQGDITKVPDGTLLGRQNIKWGYKENQVGDIGMGLDPFFYPRAGQANWPKLLNKALAMIVNSIGYLDYDEMRTPYKYVGHCDVGGGTGILRYKPGTTCYTRIDDNQPNPDLLAASNENISYVAFDRLTRPIVELNIKLILAQNPNIWAIAGNEVGISRLIRTKNPDILNFLISSPHADTEALRGIIDILPQISNDWFDESNFSSLAYLIAQHPNANDEIYRKLIIKFDEANNVSENDNFGLMTLFGGIAMPESNTPYICVGGEEIINRLIGQLDKNLQVEIQRRISIALLFAPQLTKKQLIKLIPHLSKSLSDAGDSANTLAQKYIYAYILPMESNNSWAFDNFENFSISAYNKFTFQTSRQIPIFLQLLKDTLYRNEIYVSQPQGMVSMKDELVKNTRDKKCYDWIWRRRKGLSISPEELLIYPYSVKTREEPLATSFFESKHFLTCIGEGDLWKVRYDFESYSGVKRLRQDYPKNFVSAILSDVELIQKLGWGVVAGWLREEKQFYQYVDLVYKQSFKNLYLGRGRFAKPPEDIFELYESIENIDVLNDAAVDAVNDMAGLSRNPFIPTSIQAMLYDKWLLLSQEYEGSYEEYYAHILGELSKNPNTSPTILEGILEQGRDIWGHDVAQNPNTYIKTLLSLYNSYPSQVLNNIGLSDKAYIKLWNHTWKVLNIQLLENPNRLFDNFRKATPDVLEAHKGMKIRKGIIEFITQNSYAKFWRAGNIKKGKFAQLSNKNLYSEPIADYPLTPEGKVMVIKFYEHTDEHFKNELWHLDKLKMVDENTVFVEGVKNYWEGDKRTSTHVAENFPINEFFNYIPESERGEDVVVTGDDGEEKIVVASRWDIDNIVVIQDVEVQTKGEKIPSWRFDINQEQVNNIISSYVERGMDIEKLIESLENYKNLKNYELSLNQLFKVIDDNDLWTVELINNNISYLMRSRGAQFIGLKNIKPTEKILNLSIAQNLEEIKALEIYDVGMNDLPALQERILDYDNIPMAYIYYVLINSNSPAVLKKAKELRRMRGQEFIDYYRLKNPAPTRN